MKWVTLGTIKLDSQKLFNGLAYHLQQQHQPFWKRTSAITPDSVARLHDRLERSSASVSVSRFDWQRMSDIERLNYLLDATETTGVYLPDSDVLELTSFNDVKQKHKRSRRTAIRSTRRKSEAEESSTGEEAEG